MKDKDVYTTLVELRKKRKEEEEKQFPGKEEFVHAMQELLGMIIPYILTSSGKHWHLKLQNFCVIDDATFTVLQGFLRSIQDAITNLEKEQNPLEIGEIIGCMSVNAKTSLNILEKLDWYDERIKEILLEETQKMVDVIEKVMTTP